MLVFVRRNIAFEKRGKIHVACKERNKRVTIMEGACLFENASGLGWKVSVGK